MFSENLSLFQKHLLSKQRKTIFVKEMIFVFLSFDLFCRFVAHTKRSVPEKCFFVAKKCIFSILFRGDRSGTKI